MRHYLRLIKNLPFSVKLFLLTEMLFGFSIGMWSLNLNFHLLAKGISKLDVGTVLLFGSIATAVFSLVAGEMSDRIGFHKAMVFGCIMQGMGMILITFAPSLAFLYTG